MINFIAVCLIVGLIVRWLTKPTQRGSYAVTDDTPPVPISRDAPSEYVLVEMPLDELDLADLAQRGNGRAQGDVMAKSGGRR